MKQVIKELRLRNPYPEDIFRQHIDDVVFWKRVTSTLKKEGISPESVFGCWGRQVWNNCILELENIIKDKGARK